MARQGIGGKMKTLISRLHRVRAYADKQLNLGLWMYVQGNDLALRCCMARVTRAAECETRILIRLGLLKR